MLVRKCARGHDISIHKNTKPSMNKVLHLEDGTNTVLTYPDSKDYFLVVDGLIVKKSDSFKTVEEEFVTACESKHTTSNGRIDIVKHKLVNNKVVAR